MNNKTDFTIRDVNMTKDEFFKHYTILLKSALNYAKLYAYYSYDEYYELIKLCTSRFNTRMMKDEIKLYEREMEYYNNLFDELEILQAMEVESKDLNEKFKIMKMFNELMYVL